MEKKQFVWVFTAEQAWDGEITDIIVKVFSNERSAVNHMRNFLCNGGGEESVVEFVERKGWVTEIDNPLFYRAYEDGYYATNHVECTVDKYEVNK